MASRCFPDIFTWIRNLPPIHQWNSNSIFTPISLSSSSHDNHPSVKLCARLKGPQSKTLLYFAIVVDVDVPMCLWSSKSAEVHPDSSNALDEEAMFDLMINLIEAVLGYGSNRSNSMIRVAKLDPGTGFNGVFNLVFFTLMLLVCIYEVPVDICLNYVNDLTEQLVFYRSSEAARLLLKLLGSNLEEQWMRSINLAITNWFLELQASPTNLRTPSPFFSSSLSTFGLWKVQLYCPVMAMVFERSSNHPIDSRLHLSLNFHQLEGVLQFNYNVVIRDMQIDVIAKIDNIRFDVARLVNEQLMAKMGAGQHEKHFPSRISLQLTPADQTNVMSISVSKSSENPEKGIETGKTIEGTFDPPNSLMSLSVSAGESSTISLKPWKFEQSANGYSANLNWILYDSVSGKEVFSSKPSRISMLNPRAWFRERYSRAFRAFTRQGGVVFAGDEYGESVGWKVDKRAIGKTMEWEVRGCVWLTYWPNKRRTFYSETRKLEFRETLHLKIA